MLAAHDDAFEIAELLLDRGAAIDAQDKVGVCSHLQLRPWWSTELASTTDDDWPPPLPTSSKNSTDSKQIQLFRRVVGQH